MKLIRIFFVFFLLTINSFYSQSKNENNLLNEFKKTIIEYNEELTSKENYNLSTTQIKTTLKTLYQTYECIPIIIEQVITRDQLRIKEEYQNNDELYYEKVNKSLGILRRNVLDDLQKRISPLDYHLLKTNIVAKAKVLSKEIEYKPYVIEIPDFKFQITRCKIQVEDIIKGSKEIKIGDIIEVFYREAWLDNAETEWISNNSYLFNLRYNMRDINDFSIAIVTGLENTDGYFPIVDNVLHDSRNFFKLGKTINWTKFKNDLTKYIISKFVKEEKANEK
ncbi:MAG TPA: hypothetical protein ENN33_12450 [Ignavibacteria bacterium]|nr:hypothetical protein [Ignavibacteria bacterium]